MNLRIKELRKKKGLTGPDLAEMAGCSKSYISEIESGKKWPSGRLLRAFAKALDVSIYDLIDGDDLGAELAAHISVMKDLRDEDRKAVLRHAAVLLEQGAARAE